METKFVVLGNPQGKGRPRFSVRRLKNGESYTNVRTPDQTVLYENQIKFEYGRQCGILRFPDEAQLLIRIDAFYEMPKSVSKKKKELMESGKIRPTKKPDWDNVGKVFCDALNGIAYRDDSQIVGALVRKFYGMPRVEVTIKEI